jgi:hypothetical protein
MNSWKKTIQVAIYIFCFLSITKSNATNSNLTTPCDTTAPTFIASGPTTFCSGGSVTLSDSQGRILHWSNGADSISITVASSGNYSAYYDSAGCVSNTTSIEVIVKPKPTGVYLDCPYQLCQNDSGLVTILGNTFGLSYQWDDGSFGSTIWLKNFQRSVIITNSVGCSEQLYTNTYITYVNPIFLTGDLDICRGESTTLSVDNPDPNETYYWSDGQTGPSITVSPFSTATYSVINWSASGMCNSYAEVDVNVHVPVATITGVSTLCSGQNSSLSATGGNQFLWSTGATGSGILINPTSTTTYTVTVTDWYGCTAKVSKIISVGQYPNITISGDTTICNRDTAHLIASGALNYVWSTGDTTASINLYNYSSAYVTGTSSLGCSTTKWVQIIFDNTAVPSLTTTNNILTICNGQTTTISDTNSTITSYLWSTGSTNNSITVSPTTTTNYTLSTTSASGCQMTTNFTLNVDTPSYSVLNNYATILQGQSRTIYSNAVGSSYLWSTGETTSNITVTPIQTTSYVLTVTFPGGCSSTDTTIIYVDSIPTISGPDTVCANTPFTLTATGGGTYRWSPGQETTSSVTRTITPSGNYTIYVYVFTPHGAYKTLSKVVYIKAMPYTNISSSTTICKEDSSRIILNAGTGTTFQWSNGATNDTIWVHPQTTSTYTATITNSNGCTKVLQATVNIRNTAVVNILGDTVICKGAGATLTGSGGKNYYWSTGSLTSQIHVSPNASQMYSVYAKDSSGCLTITDSVYLLVLNPANFVISGDQNICRGDTTVLSTSNSNSTSYWSTGDTTTSITVNPPTTTIYSAMVMDPSNGCIATDTAVLSVNQGVTPYSGQICVYYIPNCTPHVVLVAKYSDGIYYLWSTGETSSYITVPAAPGTYSVTISNHDGCNEKYLSVTIDSSICGCNAPNISGNNTICLGGSTTLTANSYANPQPIGYIWSNGATTKSITVSPTTTTTYTVQMILDSCIQTESFTVNILTDTIAPINGVDTLCVDNISGISLTTLNNGLSYLWSTGSTSGSSGSINPASPSQNYTVTITYPGGCTITGSKTVYSVPKKTFTVIGDSTICDGDSILLIGSDSTLNYWWNGLGRNESGDSVYFSPTSSGDIIIYGSIYNSTTYCSSYITYPLHFIPNEEANIIGNTIVCQGSTVTLQSNNTGTLNWSNGSNNNSITITPNNNQTIVLTNTTQCGYVSSDTITIHTISNSQTSNYDTTICASNEPIKIIPHLIGDYQWNNNSTDTILTVYATHDTTVFVDITLNGGCIEREVYSITILQNPVITFSGDTLICQEELTTLTAHGGIHYLWENGYTSNAIMVQPFVDTWYSVTATDALGCVTIDSVFIDVMRIPQLNLYAPKSFCSGQIAQIICSATSIDFNDNYYYLWSNGATGTTINATINSDTTFSVLVTGKNGCSNETSSRITTNINQPIINGATFLCKGKSTTLSISNNDAPIGSTYLWSNGATTKNINVTPQQTTTYTVTISWPGGCTTTANKTITVDSIPAITFTGNNQLCKGGTTTIRSVGGNDPYWYGFGFKDSLVVSPSTTTTYQVQVSNANGCTKTGSYTVNVINSPVTFTGDSTMCVNASINLTASGGTSYNWNTGATSNSITVSPSQYSNYIVTVTNGSTCSAFHTFPIYILTTPTASISGDLFACENETTILTASVGNNYLWSTGDTTRSITIPPNTAASNYSVSVYGANGCIANTATIHHLIPPPIITVNGSTSRCGAGSLFLNAYQSGATYLWSTGSTSSSINYTANSSSNITLTITNNYGCTNDTTIAITVNVPPAPIISSSTTNLCDGDSILLTCNLNNVTYSWSNQDTTIGTYINQQGNYNVFCTDNNGCTGLSNTLQITNVSSPPPVLSSLADTICNGDSVNILATGANQYQWSPSVNISNASSNTPLFYPTNSTTYTLTGTNLYGCESSTTYSILVNQLPIVNAGTDTSINNGNSLQLGGNPTATGLGPFTYQWTPGINLNDSLLANPTVMPDSTSYYYVTTTDGNGCTNRDSILVTVTNLQGLNNHEIISTISLNPNPAINSITIKINSETTGPFEISVFNASGQLMLDLIEEKSLIQLEKNINIETWDSGVYYLQVKNNNWNKTIRFIKVE